jgi:hypothetical protein
MIIINVEEVNIWKEVVMAYSKVLYRPEGTKRNHNKS